jgi:serine/threonine protein kinase
MNNYDKIREIGKGSYGVVWLVKDKKDKKNVSKKNILKKQE